MDSIYSKHTLKSDVRVLYGPNFSVLRSNAKILRMKPNDFHAFVIMSSMWSVRHILEQIDAPRYLTQVTKFSKKPLIVHVSLTVLCLLELWNIYMDL